MSGRTRPGDNHLGPVLFGEGADLVVIDIPVFVQAVGHHPVMLARKVDGRTVGEMAAVGEVHAQDRVADVAEREIDRLIGLCARVGLHIGMLGAKQLAGTAAGDLLDNIDTLAAAVVALAGVALSILVGQNRPHRREDRGGDDVFARNQFDIAALAFKLLLHGGADFWIAGADKADGVHHLLVHKILSPFAHLCYYNNKVWAPLAAVGRAAPCVPVYRIF